MVYARLEPPREHAPALPPIATFPVPNAHQAVVLQASAFSCVARVVGSKTPPGRACSLPLPRASVGTPVRAFWHRSCGFRSRNVFASGCG